MDPAFWLPPARAPVNLTATGTFLLPTRDALHILPWTSLRWENRPNTKKQGPHVASWSAQFHARMLGTRRGATEDTGAFWTRMRRMVHQCTKQHDAFLVSTFRTQEHKMAGNLARLDDTYIVARTLLIRDLSWWRQHQQNGGVDGDKKSGVHRKRFACWKWERDLELSHGPSMRYLADCEKTCGSKATAQARPRWKALEQQKI